MALDLRAVVRAVGGVCVEQRLPERTPIDGVAELASFVVVGNPDYATLVTSPTAELRQRLARDGAGALPHAVFVSEDDGAGLRAELAEHGMTAILGARLGGAALHATLIALVADERAAADRLVAAGMKVLTQAARRGGITAVIAELAHRIDGWAVLLDAQGQLIASAGAGRLHVSDAAAVALGRPVRVRHRGLQVHQVGSDRDVAGYLVVATRSSRTSHSRDLASLASALFDLLLRTHDPSLTEHLGRSALLDVLLGGGEAARTLLRSWGVHAPSLTGFALAARTRAVELERMLRLWLDEMGAEHVFATRSGRIVGFVRDDLAGELAPRAASVGVHLGLGRSAPAEALGRSAVQARQALESALEDGVPVVAFDRIPTVELVLSALPDSRGEALAGLLDPIREPGGAHGELGRTLRVFLSTNGGHRASAESLGIHRQTLVSRIRRIEDLTGLSLDRADDRSAAWLALRAAGL